jgi:amino acid transporter
MDHSHAGSAPALPVSDEPAEYRSEFKREMGFWGNLALGFTYLSPVVGVYTTIGAAIAISGAPAFWWLVIAGFGQLLVAMVFGEVVSQYPIAGGIYPWNRKLWGRKWGWMSGWVYAVAICATIASVAYGAGPFLGSLLEVEMSPLANVMLALGILVIATLINYGGTKLLAKVAFFGFVAEIVATVVIGAWLLIGARKHDLSVLFTDFRPADLQGDAPFAVAFVGAAIMGIYLYYGFEANGDVAEEVVDPGRVIPKAMRMTVYIGGIASMFIALGLILAIPDFRAVMDGTATDPIGELFLSVFGAQGFKIVLVVVLVSYLSCTISLQAAASRLLFSMGRDRQLPGSALLRRFSERRAVPPYSLAAAGLLPAAFVVISLLSADALIAIVSFAALGIYLAFASMVAAYLRARFKGWQPSGHFRMGLWGVVVGCVALAYQLFAMFTLVQPIPGAVWYEAWLVALVAIVVLVVGLVYMTSARPYLNEPASLADGRDYAEPISPTEEIVDMAVRIDGGTPHPYPHRDAPRDGLHAGAQASAPDSLTPDPS